MNKTVDLSILDLVTVPIVGSDKDKSVLSFIEASPNKTWEPHVMWAMAKTYELFKKKHLDRKFAVLDIGANIGVMSKALDVLTEYNSLIASVEPAPESFSYLKLNTLSNKSKTHIFNLALGDIEGSVDMSFFEDSTGSSFVNPDHKDSKVLDKSVMVELKTLDSFFVSNLIPLGFKTLDLIKIDVEGGETKVLEGSSAFFTANNRPVMIIECNSICMRDNFNDEPEHLISVIKYFGYKIRILLGVNLVSDYINSFFDVETIMSKYNLPYVELLCSASDNF